MNSFFFSNENILKLNMCRRNRVREMSSKKINNVKNDWNMRTLFKNIKRQKKTIKNEKRKKFKKTFAKTTNFLKNLWRFVWGYSASSSRASLIRPSLRTRQTCILAYLSPQIAHHPWYYYKPLLSWHFGSTVCVSNQKLMLPPRFYPTKPSIHQFRTPRQSSY